MAMKRSGTSTRKPPEPSESHDVIADWMRRIMPDLQPLVERIDAMVREALDEPRYALKWKKAYYGLPERGWVVELVAYDVSVNVVFLGGADFDDPPPLGEGNRSRYVKLRSIDELEESDLATWIDQATRTDGWT